MKPSEEKLFDNNLDAIRTFLEGLRIIRVNGGYGQLDLKVQNDIVTVEEVHIRFHLAEKEKAYRA